MRCFGFNVSVDYNDISNYCGRKDNQWMSLNDWCGICGDPYQGIYNLGFSTFFGIEWNSGLRDHENGGKYVSLFNYRKKFVYVTLCSTLEVPSREYLEKKIPCFASIIFIYFFVFLEFVNFNNKSEKKVWRCFVIIYWVYMACLVIGDMVKFIQFYLFRCYTALLLSLVSNGRFKSIVNSCKLDSTIFIDFNCFRRRFISFSS